MNQVAEIVELLVSLEIIKRPENQDAKNVLNLVLMHCQGWPVKQEELSLAKYARLNLDFTPQKDSDYARIADWFNSIKMLHFKRIENKYDAIKLRTEKPGFPVKVATNFKAWQPLPTPRKT